MSRREGKTKGGKGVPYVLNPRGVRRKLAAGRREFPVVDHGRPKIRGECRRGVRPCPFVSCSYHLMLDVSRSGAIKVNHPEGLADITTMTETCSLDVAERTHGQTLAQVGGILRMSRERVRQIESAALAKLRRHGGSVAEVLPDEPGGSDPRISKSTGPLRVILQLGVNHDGGVSR